MEVEERFWSKATWSHEAECWEWLAFKDGLGYGYFGLPTGPGGPVMGLAHRVAYELEREEIPPGMTVDHLCRNRGCVNPWHMEVVTQGVNTLRGNAASARNARKVACGVCGGPYTQRARQRVCLACNRRTYHERKRKP